MCCRGAGGRVSGRRRCLSSCKPENQPFCHIPADPRLQRPAGLPHPAICLFPSECFSSYKRPHIPAHEGAGEVYSVFKSSDCNWAVYTLYADRLYVSCIYSECRSSVCELYIHCTHRGPRHPLPAKIWRCLSYMCHICCPSGCKLCLIPADPRLPRSAGPPHPAI